jgi:hypothetical protein
MYEFYFLKEGLKHPKRINEGLSREIAMIT